MKPHIVMAGWLIMTIIYHFYGHPSIMIAALSRHYDITSSLTLCNELLTNLQDMYLSMFRLALAYILTWASEHLQVQHPLLFNRVATIINDQCTYFRRSTIQVIFGPKYRLTHTIYVYWPNGIFKQPSHFLNSLNNNSTIVCMRIHFVAKNPS